MAERDRDYGVAAVDIRHIVMQNEPGWFVGTRAAASARSVSTGGGVMKMAVSPKHQLNLTVGELEKLGRALENLNGIPEAVGIERALFGAYQVELTKVSAGSRGDGCETEYAIAGIWLAEKKDGSSGGSGGSGGSALRA